MSAGPSQTAKPQRRGEASVVRGGLATGLGSRGQGTAREVGRFGWLRERGMGASVLVAAISAAFGVVLLSTTELIAAVLRADPFFGSSDTLAFVLSFLGAVLVGVAVYVAAVVTANTFATVVAGRTRRIALLRLLGASARAQRVEVARQGLVVGVLGAALGLVVGAGMGAVGIAVAERLLGSGALEVAPVQPLALLPAAVVALTTWAAAWAGSRRVLTVTPLQALGGAVERSPESISPRSGRNIAAIVLFAIGGALLALGVLAGLITPLGVVIAFVGGILSFTGLAAGATLVLPPVLRVVGRMLGRSASARLAAENALRHPERSSRSAIGVVIGVSLVTMFAVALETVRSVVHASAGGAPTPEMDALLDAFTLVMSGLVGVSALIAAVGLVNLLTLGVVQRRRELGLLRALGMSNRQVRGMVLREAAHLTVAAVVTGLVLGIGYGWAGAQSVLGSVPMPPDWESPTLVLPAIPVVPVAVIALATVVLTLVAAVVPTRLATRTTPLEALAE
jgi:putative ABC transport system permease protein